MLIGITNQILISDWVSRLNPEFWSEFHIKSGMLIGIPDSIRNSDRHSRLNLESWSEFQIKLGIRIGIPNSILHSDRIFILNPDFGSDIQIARRGLSVADSPKSQLPLAQIQSTKHFQLAESRPDLRSSTGSVRFLRASTESVRFDTLFIVLFCF